MWIFLLSDASMGASLAYAEPPSTLYLPYEYTSVPILTGNVNPFDIDPEQTVSILISNTDPFDIDPEQTTLITSGNVNLFDIDPEQTTLITSGLTSSD